MAAGLSDAETPFLPSHQIGELLFTPLVGTAFPLGFLEGAPQPLTRLSLLQVVELSWGFCLRLSRWDFVPFGVEGLAFGRFQIQLHEPETVGGGGGEWGEEQTMNEENK